MGRVWRDFLGDTMTDIFTGSPIRDCEIRLQEGQLYDKTSVMRILTDVFTQYETPQPKTYELAVTEQSKEEKALKMFLVSKRINGLSDRTIKYYQSEIKLWMKFLQGRSFLDVSPDDIRLYFATCEFQNGNSKTSLNNKRLVLSTFYHWLRDEEYIAKCAIDKIPKIKQEKIVRKPFTLPEIEQLRDKARNTAKNDLEEARNLALLELLLSTASRIGEVAGMKRKDVDFNSRKILVFGKGQKERHVYLNDVATMRLERYLALRVDDNPYLFVSLLSPYRKLNIAGMEIFIRNLGRAAGVPDTHPHRFRRTAATTALNRGMPIDQVKEMLGHENIETTLIYARQLDANLDAAFRKFMN